MKNKRSGFTIVELLAVVAILAVLLGLVGTAAASAIKDARGKKIAAMKHAWKSAITAYYAQKGQWPDALERKINDANETLVTFGENDISELNAFFQQIVKEAVDNNNALLDLSSVYVCTKKNIKGCNDNHGDKGGKCEHCDNAAHDCRKLGCFNGMEFTKARAKGKEVGDMAFGYPGVEHGCFRRFYIEYNTQTDSVRVMEHYTGCKKNGKDVFYDGV